VPYLGLGLFSTGPDTFEGVLMYLNEYHQVQYRKFYKSSGIFLAVTGGDGLILGKKIEWASQEFFPDPDPNKTYYAYIDENSTFLHQETPLTPEQIRHNIFLGIIRSDDSGNFSTVTQNPNTLKINTDLREMADSVGPINIVGNKISHTPDATQGTLAINAGKLFSLGSNNFFENPTNPNVLANSAQDPLTFAYGYVNGSGDVVLSTPATTPDFRQYSNNGVLVTVGQSNYTIQRIYLIANALDYVAASVLVLYGTILYPKKDDAFNGVLTETPSLPSFIHSFLLRGYIIANGTTSMASDVEIVQTDKFGEN